MLKNLFALLLFASSYLVDGQIIDSTKIGFVTVNSDQSIGFDTVLSLSTYLNFNDYQRDDFGIISMGNQGDVRRRLFFSPILSLQPNLGIDGYFKNYVRKDDIPFYNVKVPTGGVRFLQSYSKGQFFGGTFTVNPMARLNFFIDYQRFNSQGNYLNQENKSDHLQFSSYYSTINGVYDYSVAISWNNFKNTEYGGIAIPSQFETNEYADRALLAINLSNSGTHVRASESRLNQSLRLFKVDSLSDLRLFYRLTTESQFVAFESSDSVFTKNAIFQSVEISDSVRLQNLTNYAGVNLVIAKNTFFAGIQYSSYQYGNDYFLQKDNLLGLRFEAKGELKSVAYEADFENYITENYQGSLVANGRLNYYFGKKKRLNWDLDASFKNVNASLFSQRFISNNFVWDNDFGRIKEGYVNTGLAFKNYKIGGGIRQLNGYVYFNELAEPQQLDGALLNYTADLQARFKLAKGFYSDNRVRFQTVNNEAVVRIPDWVLRSILYYEFKAFNDVLNVHFGTEFNYFSSFTSDAYMPATTVMYLQNNQNIGNFPYFNFFFDFKIKELVFFVRLENITQGLFDYNYYAAPTYPLPDFNFRFGATWRFFN